MTVASDRPEIVADSADTTGQPCYSRLEEQ